MIVRHKNETNKVQQVKETREACKITSVETAVFHGCVSKRNQDKRKQQWLVGSPFRFNSSQVKRWKSKPMKQESLETISKLKIFLAMRHSTVVSAYQRQWTQQSRTKMCNGKKSVERIIRNHTEKSLALVEVDFCTVLRTVFARLCTVYLSECVALLTTVQNYQKYFAA